eukprot:5341280-Amphidinium_carterae.2
MNQPTGLSLGNTYIYPEAKGCQRMRTQPWFATALARSRDDVNVMSMQDALRQPRLTEQLPLEIGVVDKHALDNCKA